MTVTIAKAASAGAWSAADIVLRQVVQFAVSIILARLLAVEDFAPIVLLTFFTSLSIMFVQGGLSLALVQQQDTTREQETAVFWTNLCAGILFALILILIAPAAATFLEQPVMDPLMYVAAAQVVLSSFGAVHQALLTRALRFDQLTKTGILSTVLSGAAGVGAAYAGWGVWALAAQLIIQAAANSAALWWISDWRPGWSPRFASIRGMLGFGINISMSSALDILYTQGFNLVIGKVYGGRDLALLNRASNIQNLPTGIISQVIARTALPLFAARTDDREALLRGFRMSVNLAMLLSLPLMAGLAVLSDLVILVLLGPKWLDAAPVLVIGAIAGMLMPLHVLNLQLLLARGDSKTFLSLEVQKKIVGVIVFGAACFWGIMGVAYGWLVFGAAAFYINAKPTAALGYGPLRQLHHIRGIGAATLFMTVGVYGLRKAIDLPPMPLLVVLVVAGGVLYGGFCVVARLNSVKEAYVMIESLVGRERIASVTARFGRA